VDFVLLMWTLARPPGTLFCVRVTSAGAVMPYSGLMPSLQAIQQAVREPLLEAPTDPNGFAVYIFERARKIDRERALAKNPTVQSERRGDTSAPMVPSE
jgi:hypothetical protein